METCPTSRTTGGLTPPARLTNVAFLEQLGKQRIALGFFLLLFALAPPIKRGQPGDADPGTQGGAEPTQIEGAGVGDPRVFVRPPGAANAASVFLFLAGLVF